MDVDRILQLEKMKLQSDKERLNARFRDVTLPQVNSSSNAAENVTEIDLNDNKDYCDQYTIKHNLENDSNSGIDFVRVADLCPVKSNAKNCIPLSLPNRMFESMQTSSMATAVLPAISPSPTTQTDTFSCPTNKLHATLNSEKHSSIVINTKNLSKFDKNQTNSKEMNLLLRYEEYTSNHPDKDHRTRKKDDMEQWVTDTFYSYFPGFNNENEKRQSYLRDKQLEYQQNFLRHQMAVQAGKNTNAASFSKNAESEIASQLQLSPNLRSGADKTDLQIIVNNPDYGEKNARPGSARQKLLQDLQHTEISKIVNSDVITERNRRSAELELARKKDYQKELIAQIEEKKRSIEMIREKDRRQEEALTRKLQEQLKTIRLEEELEKEKLRMDKIRFDSEQNRLMREHLMKKLENDAKLLRNGGAKAKSENDKSSPRVTEAHENNKVYKYFSNSARGESYHRSMDRFLDSRVGDVGDNRPDFDLRISEIPTNRSNAVERECYHLMEKICPQCNAPLKKYINCCLKCERQLPLQHNSDKSKEGGREAFCENCQRLYAFCDRCEHQEDICRACHQKRKVCMSCRRSLCSFCLEEVATGRDAEKDESESQKDSTDTTRNSAQSTFDSQESERSFQVLEVKYPKNFELMAANRNISNNKKCLNSTERPPFSINLDPNSIFHPQFCNNEKLNCKQLFNATNGFTDIDQIRSETNKKLSRYIKNYGDLQQIKAKDDNKKSNYTVKLHDQSTQTSSNGSGRRDIVMIEQNNLSMPLLREMPKMTRKESLNLQENPPNNRRTIENLNGRWEVPAVQKRIITSKSPRVLTQLGTIRKQLQSQKLQLEY